MANCPDRTTDVESEIGLNPSFQVDKSYRQLRETSSLPELQLGPEIKSFWILQRLRQNYNGNAQKNPAKVSVSTAAARLSHGR